MDLCSMLTLQREISKTADGMATKYIPTTIESIWNACFALINSGSFFTRVCTGIWGSSHGHSSCTLIAARYY
jgi:hypothetical protein